MKIGILTFWGVPNQGTFAQAYALHHYLQKICPGDEIYQIAYLHSRHIRFYEEYREQCDNYQNRLRSDRLFIEAYKSIPHIYLQSEELLEKEEFDLLVLGSDIIWDYSINVFGDDVHLFGNKMNAKNIISYAPSFGTCKAKRPVPEYVKNGLLRLDKIAVRDTNSADIVEKVTGKRPEVVLDPTWLWDFECDEALINVNKGNSYIFIYGENFEDKFIYRLKKYAKETGKSTIALNAYNREFDWCDVVIDSKDKPPLEIISYFKYAECVATNTFHGMMFGLLFNKKTAYCKSDFVWAKLSSLLTYLNLDRLYMDSNDVYEMFNYDWNNSGISEKIDLLREKSKKYLLDIVSELTEQKNL